MLVYTEIKILLYEAVSASLHAWEQADRGKSQTGDAHAVPVLVQLQHTC